MQHLNWRIVIFWCGYTGKFETYRPGPSDDNDDDSAAADDDAAAAAADDDDDDDDLYCEAKACLGQRRTPACNYYSTHNRLKLNHHHHHWHQHQHHHHAADDAEC